MKRFVYCGCRLGVSLLCAGALLSNLAFGQAATPPATSLLGQSRTLLPDGSWLLVGGMGPSGAQNTVTIAAPGGSTNPLSIGLARARAWQTATVLPQGTVLILGGMDAAGVIDTAELFNLTTLQFQTLL